jgi:HK97 family phage portal protein
MIFPEIVSRVKALLDRSNSGPIQLDLKGMSTFSPSWGAWEHARSGFPGLAGSYALDLPSLAGVSVTLDTALQHSVVWACNRIISESVGMLPCVMMRRKGSAKLVCDGQRGNPTHPLYSLMHDLPNEELTATAFQEMLTSHCLLQGNSYAHITRRSGTGEAIQLDPLQPQNVTPDREIGGRKRLVYVVKESGVPDRTYTLQEGKPHDILHLRGLGWDGIRGYSVIAMGRQSIGSAIAAERNIARFWANGGRVPYHLEVDRPFADATLRAKYLEDWRTNYSEPHKVPLLEGGTKMVRDGLSMVDAQAIESRLFSIHEICRWFLVSPHLVGDLSRATFSNIEQLALEFVKMTLSTWINRWEQELYRCALTPEERAQGYFFRHDLRALLRGDFISRMQGYAMLLDKGVNSPDEIRDMEDQDPIQNGAGKSHHIQLAMATLPGTGDPMPAESRFSGSGSKPSATLSGATLPST